jgi:hypothetical protein
MQCILDEGEIITNASITLSTQPKPTTDNPKQHTHTLYSLFPDSCAACAVYDKVQPSTTISVLFNSKKLQAEVYGHTSVISYHDSYNSEHYKRFWFTQKYWKISEINCINSRQHLTLIHNIFIPYQY